VKTYEYRGLDAQGRSVRGMIEAAGAKQARESLAAAGILAERVAPAGRQMRVNAEARASLYRELGSLLRAGMPLVQSIGVLMDSPGSSSRALLAGVRDRVQEGVSLAAALKAGTSSVSDFEEAIIAAAERAAAVPDALESLADLLEQGEKVRHRLRSAMVYPAIVTVAGVLVAGLMLGFLVPRAQDVLAQSRGSLPGLTVFMMGFGRWVVRWGLAVPLAGLLAGLWHYERRRRDRAYRVRADRVLFRLPVFGYGYVLLAQLRFARTLAVLVRSGVGLVEGVALAGRATGSPWLADLADEQAEALRHGSRLSEAVRRMGPLGRDLPAWIQVGEMGGELARLLDHAAQRCLERWERSTTRSLSILEPMLILCVGGFVLLVTLSVLLPVLNLSKGLGVPAG